MFKFILFLRFFNPTLRTFLNQFRLVRYVDEDLGIQDNVQFNELFAWLISPMANDLFDGLENYLLYVNQEFLKRSSMFRTQVCGLVALKKLRKYSMKKELRKVYLLNMFKYRNFNNLKRFMTNEVTPFISKKVEEYNLTKSEISSACNDPKNTILKKEMEAMILSYMYLFLDTVSYLGAGDLAASELPTGLSSRSVYYEETHGLLSQIFKELTNGTIPGSIFETPQFFTFPDRFTYQQIEIGQKGLINKMKNVLNFIDLPYESLRNYHYLWYTYNKSPKEKFILICQHHVQNCSDPTVYNFPNTNSYFETLRFLRANPTEGIIIEANVTKAPCTDQELITKMNIRLS